METEFPRYDSCQPCETLTHVKTTIGKGYGCTVCQMTYIQVEKGAYIPFDQAMVLWQAKRKRDAAKAKLAANRAKIKARPRKRKKRKR